MANSAQEKWESAWQQLHREAVAMKEPLEATERLSQMFADLRPLDRSLIEHLLAGWVLSDDESKRYDALSLIGRHDIMSAGPSLREALVGLASDPSPGAPYVAARIRRILAAWDR